MKKTFILLFAALLSYVTANAQSAPKSVKAVDLGLSVKWASCNIGATTPEEYGDYFAWGETTSKSSYYFRTYKWCSNTLSCSMSKYCIRSRSKHFDKKTILEKNDDAACVNWGGTWRMPTKEEQNELLNTSNCTWTWTAMNGVNGYKVVSKKNGNSIFLPAAGIRYDDSLYNADSKGIYWSSSLYLEFDSSQQAYAFDFDSRSVELYNFTRERGHSVRAVCP